MADLHLRAEARARIMAWAGSHGATRLRREQLARARGAVLEISWADPTEPASQPTPEVAPVVAIGGGSVEPGAFEPESFDTVVTSMALCRVPDQDRALSVIRRWIRPGGELLFVEHGVAPGLRGALQRAATPAWSTVMNGCRLDRDPISTLRRSGWVVAELQRFRLPGAGAFIGNGVYGVAKPRRTGEEAAA